MAAAAQKHESDGSQATQTVAKQSRFSEEFQKLKSEDLPISTRNGNIKSFKEAFEIRKKEEFRGTLPEKDNNLKLKAFLVIEEAEQFLPLHVEVIEKCLNVDLKTLRRLSGLLEVEANAIPANGKAPSLTAQEFSAAAAPRLPEKAPALWAARTRDEATGRKPTPVEFILEYYGPWLQHGLARADIRRLDPTLYQAYATWISRHAEDDLHLPAQTRSTYSQDELTEATGVITSPQRAYWTAKARESRARKRLSVNGH